MVTRTAVAGVGESLPESIDDYRLSLHAAGQSANTQAVYTLALRYLDAFLAERGMPRQLSAIRREHIEAWLGSVRDAGRAPATVSVYFRSLQPFWRWAIEEGFVRESPMGTPQCPGLSRGEEFEPMEEFWRRVGDGAGRSRNDTSRNWSSDIRSGIDALYARRGVDARRTMMW